jgi:DNA-binding MarR family transcriptional regulator
MDEREFELVNIIGAKLGSNQRDISRHMDLSLGMVNMLLRRLVSKGYIRINQLNQKKVEYILTSKGFSEKMRKSVKYTMKTISSIGLIKERLKEVLSPVVQDGHREFVILGESDFAMIVDFVLRDLCKDHYKIVHVNELTATHAQGFVLICREEFNRQVKLSNMINLVEELARDYAFANGKGS